MKLARWTVFASLWLLCVAIVAAAAWYAIDSAGRQVRVLAVDGPRGGAPVARTTTSPEQDRSPSVLRSQDVTSAAPAPTSTDPPTTSVRSSPDPTGDVRTRSATTRPSVRPSRRPTSVEPRPQLPSRPPSVERSDTRTVATLGGSVTVTCSRGEPIDFAVNPAQDWSAQVGERGDQGVDVRFRRDTMTIVVRAICIDGEPRTWADEKSEG